MTEFPRYAPSQLKVNPLRDRLETYQDIEKKYEDLSEKLAETIEALRKL
ncbi:MAG: hypothetical protein AB4426_17805 [Xenococcaceae cyanobacterium]